MNNFLDSNNRYEIIKFIGKGSFGKVYHVYDKEDNEEKAIKKLIVDSTLESENETIQYIDFQSKVEELKKSFIQESQIGRKFSHLDNIVKVEYIEIDKSQNIIIIMEYLGEVSLKNWIDENPIEKRDLKYVYKFMKELLEIFVNLHKHFIHRDIKPSNIMIKDDKFIITDLGLSKVINENDTIFLDKTYPFIPDYKAPEELEKLINGKKELDRRVDIYSLGILFYKLLTDKLPLYHPEIGEDEKTIIPNEYNLTSLQWCEEEYKRVKPPSKLNIKIDKLFDDFVLKMFKCKKEERFQSVQEVLNELESIFIRLNGFELIEKGDFIKGDGDEAKIVDVDEFFISKHHITNGEYIEFLKDTRSLRISEFSSLNENSPVVNVNWAEAIDYCKWRSKKENKTFRLPTENEWEKVCKNKKNYQYSWGSKEKSDNNNLLDVYDKILEEEIKDKSYKVLGMCGNIWQWCFDNYEQDNLKVIKGGSYDSALFEKRCSFSDYREKNTRDKTIGFRVVREIE